MAFSKKGLTIFVSICTALLILFASAQTSYDSEPHPPSISRTGLNYSKLIAQSYNGSLSTLFFQTFSVGKSNATFGFSLSELFPKIGSIYEMGTGGFRPLHIYVNLVSRNMTFPYNTFLLAVNNVNITIQINGTTYGSMMSYFTYNHDFYVASNKTTENILFGYITNVSLIVGSNYSGYKNLSVYGKTALVNYEINITPIIELGPYYKIGKSLWISHSFNFPYSEIS